MEMQVDRRVGHDGSTAVRCRDRCLYRRSRGVVCDGNDQMIPGVDVERGIFEAVRRHEAKQSPAIFIHSALIRESDAQVTVVAEESRRVTDDGAGWEPRAGIGDGLDRVKRIGGP